MPSKGMDVFLQQSVDFENYLALAVTVAPGTIVKPRDGASVAPKSFLKPVIPVQSPKIHDHLTGSRRTLKDNPLKPLPLGGGTPPLKSLARTKSSVHDEIFSDRDISPKRSQTLRFPSATWRKQTDGTVLN